MLDEQSQGAHPRLRGEDAAPDQRRQRGPGLIPGYAGRTSRSISLAGCREAHPRLRGEDCGCVRHALGCPGSSPATRGGPGLLRREDAPRRLILGYAGRTMRGVFWGATVGAHPRLRGEDPRSVLRMTPQTGSSPATRGGRLPGCGAQALAGLIPGYTGRTPHCRPGSSRPGAHPRLRGEDAFRDPSLPNDQGSSPATRGGRGQHPVHCRGDGLIPGYAGRTHTADADAPPPRAHPRLRGEDDIRAQGGNAAAGSSPATRGGHPQQSPTRGGDGLIPGYAGRTPPRPRTRRSGRAHPRLRGEDPGVSSAEALARGAHPRLRGEDPGAEQNMGTPQGSSPATRGGPGTGKPRHVCARLIPGYAGRTPGSGSPPELRGGLIPGYAGRTARSRPGSWRTRAHPRLRGEDEKNEVYVVEGQGSSPATRGGHHHRGDDSGGRGLIPGYAGRTPASRSTRATARAHPRLRGEDDLSPLLHTHLVGSSPATRGGPPR